MGLITSVTNQKIKDIKKINKKEYFTSSNLSMIKKADKLGLLIDIFAVEGLSLNVKTTLVSQEVISKISSADVLGIIKIKPSEMITSDKVIYLDEISDPLNLAKIILLMKQYNYKDLILSKNSVSIYNDKCLEIVNDLIYDINISYGDINSLMNLKEKGYQLLGTGLLSNTDLKNVEANKKRVLIFGNEARGVNLSILKACDIVIKIPIKNLDSLNVAVAASIVIDNL